ncbi:hypothetical protein H0X48_01355 [Candidatus Dependentiae bacterium]|nr:hypothetical protein [Candidatus Dependentiae bacterium]
MCFSVQASFAAALLLSTLGYTALRRVRSSRYYPFACVPMFFALQQYAEGALWLNHDYGILHELVKLAVYAFLGIAFGGWPILMPFALYLIEKDISRRIVLSLLLLWGIAFAAYSLWALSTYGAEAVIQEHHIYYSFIAPQSNSFNMFLYWIPVVGSFFVSSKRFMPLFGLIVSIALAVSYYMWYTYLTSVWCFFAALLSACVVALV